MQRVETLLQKITELANKEQHGIIEVDLMMDYTRVLYADLMEWRNRLVFTGVVPQPETTPPAAQPQVQAQMPEPEISIDTIAPVITTESFQEQLTYTPEPEMPPQNEVYEPKHEALAQTVTITEPTKTSTSQSIDGISSLVGINDKYQFINELFSNNKDDYDAVIEELETFENYPQAISWLNTYVGNRYNWDTENETVRTFYSLIEQYYKGK